MRTSSSHEEGVARDFAVLTKRALGKDGRITALECVRIDWVKGADGIREKGGKKLKFVFQTTINPLRPQAASSLVSHHRWRNTSCSSE